jgi:hypothetical protein
VLQKYPSIAQHDVPSPRAVSMRRIRLCLTLALGTLLAAAPVRAQLAPEPVLAPRSIEVHWDEGAMDCKTHSQPPLQVHAYNAQTFILRENLCATFEAPFMNLLTGSSRAMLIDTGDVADASHMPLAKTVLQLLRMWAPENFPCWWYTRTGTSITARAMDSSHICPACWQLVSISTAFGASTASWNGRTGCSRSIWEIA